MIDNLAQSLDIEAKLQRVIDANLNRLKEGVRVVEDIARYIYNDKLITSKLKSIRHKLQLAYDKERLLSRDVLNDVQKSSIKSELNRNSLEDIIIANFSRTQESARVLEEVFKLQSIELSELFKTIRYELYSVEKEYFIAMKMV